MVDFTKSKGMDPIVRQNRGPGMNLGLKKPRYGFKKAKIKDTSKARSAAKSTLGVDALLAGLKADSPERALSGPTVAYIGPASMLRQN